MIEINSKTYIEEKNIEYQYSRSSGPGGQNVNKLNTRAELSFDLRNCSTLTERQKQIIQAKLKSRISEAGQLRVVSQEFRTQSANRQQALDILIALLQNALKQKPKRIKTKVPFGAKMKRLEGKRHQSETKKSRQKPII